ncbi:MAG: hypothetical protein F4X97_08530 [Boseongicola sp. SB0662_bin_57]|nr:hypothetical protein [Boseongicola sp. SB0662_bin_57]
MTERDGRMQQDGGPGRASTIADLVAEMSVQRKALEAIYELLDERETPADYGSDIGALAKAVKANTEGIKAVGAAPALATTAEDHAAVMDAAAASAVALFREEAAKSRKALDAATAMVGEALKRDRDARRQHRRNMAFLAAGAGAMAVLWLVAAVAVHPVHASWFWRAANSETSWQTGLDILYYSDRKSHSNLVRANRIYRHDRESLDRCVESARERGGIVSCRINVAPPSF